MPESAECRIFTDQLNKEFGGQSLNSIEVVGGRFVKQPIIPPVHKLITPLLNIKFNSKGKFLYWTFGSDEERVFFITLGMTGSFGPISKHSAIHFTFDKGDVYFNDIRRFGTFKITNRDALTKKLHSLGWDPLARPIFPINLPYQLKSRHGHKTIAEVLLDQKLFAGVGNYIRSEALYLAKIHPLKRISQLSEFDIANLCNQIVKVIEEAYKNGGATIATFKDIYGNTGKFFDQFKVYSRKQDPDGRTVKKATAPDGRSIFYVEEIQK